MRFGTWHSLPSISLLAFNFTISSAKISVTPHVINPEANVGSAGKMCIPLLFDENKKYEDVQWRQDCKVLHKKYKTRANCTKLRTGSIPF
jgi:hypothetical protein